MTKSPTAWRKRCHLPTSGRPTHRLMRARPAPSPELQVNVWLVLSAALASPHISTHAGDATFIPTSVKPIAKMQRAKQI